MVNCMLRKNWFLFALLFLYLLFLCKDYFFGFFDNKQSLNQVLYDEKLRYYKNEYQEMQKLLNISYPDFKIIYSKVIFRDIYQFYNEITISKGSNDGVKEKDLVVSDKGVVGIINSVYKNSSIVSLLTNPRMELSVKINNSYGILTSVDNQIIVKNMKLNEEIKKGDLVYTSGLTDIPGNILVGEVIEIKKDDLELQYILDVKSISNLQNISYVAILGVDKS